MGKTEKRVKNPRLKEFVDRIIDELNHKFKGNFEAVPATDKIGGIEGGYYIYRQYWVSRYIGKIAGDPGHKEKGETTPKNSYLLNGRKRNNINQFLKKRFEEYFGKE